MRILGFIHFLGEDSERGKLQRNEFRGIGYFYPSREIHLAGESLFQKMSSKNVQSRGIEYNEIWINYPKEVFMSLLTNAELKGISAGASYSYSVQKQSAFGVQSQNGSGSGYVSGSKVVNGNTIYNFYHTFHF
jgi:hypothetical protein